MPEQDRLVIAFPPRLFAGDDLAQFAENWGGTPLFSQSRSATADYAKPLYANRLEFFRKIRRQIDPHGRLLNPFLAQYFS